MCVCVTISVQRNLSNTGTHGTKILVLISEVSLFQGENKCIYIKLGIWSSVVINQVSSKRGSTVSVTVVMMSFTSCPIASYYRAVWSTWGPDSCILALPALLLPLTRPLHTSQVRSSKDADWTSSLPGGGHWQHWTHRPTVLSEKDNYFHSEGKESFMDGI